MNWRTSKALWGIRIMWFAGGVVLGLGASTLFAEVAAIACGVVGFVLLGLGWREAGG